MLKKLIRQLLIAQTLSALTVSLCLLIDSIIIGQFLGENAIAAYGLANPVLLVIGAVATVFSVGVQVVCSRSLGRGSQEETNAGFSSAVALVLMVSIPFLLLVLIFRSPLATLLGAKEELLFAETRDYMTGFIIGAPATMGALVLVPFLQMAGQNGLLIAAVGTMTVTDIILDLLDVLVFKGGMFGMGLASSLSYYAALIVGGIYFFSKKSTFKFSFRLITGRTIRELIRRGIPALYGMASTIVMVYAMNHILLGTGGSTAVGAFSLLTTIGNSCNCITTGVGNVALTLSGVFYTEEDRTGLKTLLRQLTGYSVILGALISVLIVVLAPQAVSLFLSDESETARMAVQGLRVFALGMIPCCLNAMIKNAYQGTDRERYTKIISVLQNALLPILAALLLTIPFKTSGAWYYFFCGELLTLLLICLFVRLRTGRLPWKELNILMLPESFSVTPEDMIETDIRTLEDVAAAVDEARFFCLEHGQDLRFTNRIALCVEEMASNVVQHGFTADRRAHHLSVRLMNKDDRWTLRFRDDCGAFDPVHYVPRDQADALGIRLVLGLADEIHYTYALNLNNLMITLSARTVAAEELPEPM
ncbi:MAG: ATP-binding protein [Firmicutes bacterium]|nr:ATP-binding protein [Bacillota bacterium]